MINPKPNKAFSQKTELVVCLCLNLLCFLIKLAKGSLSPEIEKGLNSNLVSRLLEVSYDFVGLNVVSPYIKRGTKQS